MKLTIGRDEFADIVAWIARSLPQKASVPVLAGIKLTFDGDTLTAEGFDYEVSTQVAVAIGGGGDPGSVLASGRLLAEIAKALPAKPVELTTVGALLELVCGSARFTLPTMPVEDYPTLPDMPEGVGTIDAAVFAQAVAQTAIAASRDDTLPLMTGVRIEIDGTKLSMLATDRYRLAVREIEWQPADPDISTQILVPAKTLTEVAKTLAVGSDPITLALSAASAGEGMVGFEAAGRRMTSRLLDGANYPPVRSLFPKEVAASAVVPADELVQVVKRVALVAERTTPVLLTFTPGSDTLLVEAGGTEEARASESMQISHYKAGDQITIGFNPDYLVGGLSSMGGGHALIEMLDAFKPAVISPAVTSGQADDGERDEQDTYPHRYLIMPIRVSR
ncbi:DNA polymerase III subunit beta [Micromonospora sonchi]|uniref:Beta sliding clamp n=1 Tax=Micromonospora sonchi TaxID=1763543 RepID=A0A917WTJ5_9ACTN|nr:DNA polymerase III subunit beta [Micromonospora sonchi]GGM26830.1 DNA polymerase III subunit beta [Micromonospora sonchi]